MIKKIRETSIFSMKVYFKYNLTYLRKAKDLTQQELASQLDKGQSTVAGWENGASEPNIDLLVKLSQIFNISIDDLILTNLSDGNLIQKGGNAKKEEIGNLIGNPIGNLTPENIDIPGSNISLLTEVVNALKSIDQKFDNYLKSKEE